MCVPCCYSDRLGSASTSPALHVSLRAFWLPSLSAPDPDVAAPAAQPLRLQESLGIAMASLGRHGSPIVFQKVLRIAFDTLFVRRVAP